MTREEAKKYFDSFGKTFTLDEARLDTHKLIDNIFDDIENASCSNCEYLYQDVCVNNKSPMRADHPNQEMMCSKWRKKMTIKDYEKEHPDFDILDKNIIYALKATEGLSLEDTIEAIKTVVRSYYSGANNEDQQISI